MSASVDLTALADEIRRQAEVYRGAQQLAELLDLAVPFEEAVERARAEAEDARKIAEAARAEQARAERDRDAAKREHANAVKAMIGDLERREKEWVKEMEKRNVELAEVVRVQESALSTAREQLANVNSQLDALRRLLA